MIIAQAARQSAFTDGGKDFGLTASKIKRKDKTATRTAYQSRRGQVAVKKMNAVIGG